MINNYSRPQSIIEQIFKTEPVSSTDRINTFILGASYQLQRYDNTIERETMSGETFDKTGQSLTYENKAVGSIIDKASVRIFAEDMEVKLASFATHNTGDNYFTLVDLNTPNKIKLNSATVGTGVKVETGVTTLADEFVGRDVRVGDRVKITDPKGTRTRIVTGIEKEYTDPTFGSEGTDGAALAYPTNPIETLASDLITVSKPFGWDVTDYAGAFEDLVNGPSYGGYYGDLFILTCTVAGLGGVSKFSLRSNSGNYSADNLTVAWNTDHYELSDYTKFNGFIFSLTPDSGTEDPFVKGQQFLIQAKGIYESLSIDDSIVEASRHLLITEPNTQYAGSAYVGNKDTTYFIKVTKGSTGGVAGASLYIYDSAGVDRPITYTNILADTEYNLGSLGMKFLFQDTATPTVQDGLRNGDIYQVSVVASKQEGTSSIVVLNGSAIDITGLVDAKYTLEKVEFFSIFNGELSAQRDEAPDVSWEAGDYSVTINAELKFYDSARTPNSEWIPFEDATGKLFVSYRALLPGSINDTIFTVSSEDDIIANAGKIDMDNDLAYGLLMGLSGSQGKRIFGGKVPTNDLAGYAAILKEASNRDDLYAMAPMTLDTTIIDLVKVHTTTMSQPNKKQWRRSYVATDTSEPFAKLLTQYNESPYTAIIVNDGSGYIRRVTSSNADFIESNIKVGDKFRTNFSKDTFNNDLYDTYTVALVISSEELLLESGPSVSFGAPIKFEIWSDDDGASVAAYVATKSESLGTRRACNIWIDSPEILIDGTYVPQKVYYIAAEIAGIRSVLLPQQGLTYTQLHSVSRAPKMYTKYSQEDLDIAAAAGTFIVTQEVKGGPIFIRHQLTTKTDEGSLFYEDSVGVNADEISYAIKDFVAPYIGKRNATPSTVADLRTGYENLLIQRTSAPTFQNIGPQIISIVPGSLYVEIDSVLKDQINMGSQAELPLPLNTVRVQQAYSTLLS